MNPKLDSKFDAIILVLTMIKYLALVVFLFYSRRSMF